MNETTHLPEDEASVESEDFFDFSFVYTTARIAVYDDLRSAPRVIEVEPAETGEYIEQLAQAVYEQSQNLGGSIPYTVIRELSENFIHARFTEVVISIFDHGDTIRFADQGPGISHKKQAQMPGFTSASEPMKEYIRGVGSGLPLAREYLSMSNGSISIEDNMGSGAVVTISLARDLTPERDAEQDKRHVEEKPAAAPKAPRKADAGHGVPDLTDRQKRILLLFSTHGHLGVTDIVKLTGMPQSSVHLEFKKLEEMGLVVKGASQKRELTEEGTQVVELL